MLTRVAAAAALSGTLAAGLSAQSRITVLRNATVIDGTERPAAARTSVVIRNGWITAVTPDSALVVPRGARVVDLTGRYLVPGFIEMHGHLAIAAWEVDSSGPTPVLRFPYDEASTRELTRSQLAFGITTVRNPAGPTDKTVSLRNRVRWGELTGPRIVTAGAPLDRPGPNTAMDAVTTEAEVRAAVRRQAEAGVDLIKVYSGLDSAQVRAAIDEAHRLGLRVIGHLWRTSWTDAANDGIDGITHIIVNNEALLPPGRRAAFVKSIRGGQFMFDWFLEADFDGPEIREMIGALTAHHVSIDPTLVAFESTAWSADSAFYPAESDRFVPPAILAKTRDAGRGLRGWADSDYVRAQRAFPLMLELARRLHDAGVPLTAGTDAANPWMYHRELELLARAGLSNAEVLRAATRNGAMALGLISELGTIEVGKRADLVALDADPLADIRNTRRIAWVIQDGRPARPSAFLPARLRGGS